MTHEQQILSNLRTVEKEIAKMEVALTMLKRHREDLLEDLVLVEGRNE